MVQTSLQTHYCFRYAPSIPIRAVGRELGGELKAAKIEQRDVLGETHVTLSLTERRRTQHVVGTIVGWAQRNSVRIAGGMHTTPEVLFNGQGVDGADKQTTEQRNAYMAITSGMLKDSLKAVWTASSGVVQEGPDKPTVPEAVRLPMDAPVEYVGTVASANFVVCDALPAGLLDRLEVYDRYENAFDAHMHAFFIDKVPISPWLVRVKTALDASLQCAQWTTVGVPGHEYVPGRVYEVFEGETLTWATDKLKELWKMKYAKPQTDRERRIRDRVVRKIVNCAYVRMGNTGLRCVLKDMRDFISRKKLDPLPELLLRPPLTPAVACEAGGLSADEARIAALAAKHLELCIKLVDARCANIPVRAAHAKAEKALARVRDVEDAKASLLRDERHTFRRLIELYPDPRTHLAILDKECAELEREAEVLTIRQEEVGWCLWSVESMEREAQARVLDCKRAIAVNERQWCHSEYPQTYVLAIETEFPQLWRELKRCEVGMDEARVATACLNGVFVQFVELRFDRTQSRHQALRTLRGLCEVEKAVLAENERWNRCSFRLVGIPDDWFASVCGSFSNYLEELLPSDAGATGATDVPRSVRHIARKCMAAVGGRPDVLLPFIPRLRYAEMHEPSRFCVLRDEAPSMLHLCYPPAPVLPLRADTAAELCATIAEVERRLAAEMEAPGELRVRTGAVVEELAHVEQKVLRGLEHLLHVNADGYGDQTGCTYEYRSRVLQAIERHAERRKTVETLRTRIRDRALQCSNAEKRLEGAHAARCAASQCAPPRKKAKGAGLLASGADAGARWQGGCHVVTFAFAALVPDLWCALKGEGLSMDFAIVAVTSIDVHTLWKESVEPCMTFVELHYRTALRREDLARVFAGLCGLQNKLGLDFAKVDEAQFPREHFFSDLGPSVSGNSHVRRLADKCRALCGDKTVAHRWRRMLEGQEAGEGKQGSDVALPYTKRIQEIETLTPWCFAVLDDRFPTMRFSP